MKFDLHIVKLRNSTERQHRSAQWLPALHQI